MIQRVEQEDGGELDQAFREFLIQNEKLQDKFFKDLPIMADHLAQFVIYVRLFIFATKRALYLGLDIEKQEEIQVQMVNIGKAIEATFKRKDIFVNFFLLQQLYEETGQSFSLLVKSRLRKLLPNAIKAHTNDELQTKFAISRYPFNQYSDRIFSQKFSDSELDMICDYLGNQANLSELIEAIREKTVRL